MSPYWQSWAPGSRFALTRHHVIDTKGKSRCVSRCQEFLKNDSSGDTTKICQEFPTFLRGLGGPPCYPLPHLSFLFFLLPSPLFITLPPLNDAVLVELLYGSGFRIRKSSIQIRIQGKNLTKFNFSKFCGKKRTVLTDIEKQLFLAKVPRGQLRSQKSCQVP